MKFSTIASGIILAASSVAAQLTAPMQNYNVSSPVSNGPYVAGQVLPCTIRLFDNVVSDIALSISLDSATTGSNATYVIAASVDVSKNTGSAKQNGNTTYYEHSVNYKIPTTVLPGAYNVVFLDSKTYTKLDVPINILPAASASVIKSAASTGGAAAATSSTSAGSIFKDSGSGVAAMSPSMAIVSLACVAALAYML